MRDADQPDAPATPRSGGGAPADSEVGAVPDLTIVILCRNEEGAIAHCVGEARGFLDRNAIAGEVLVVDNGSGDRSAERAREAGARVVEEPRAGYGNAINAGIAAARGEWAILGDGDGEHDLDALEPYWERLREGSDFVFGNRFAGGERHGGGGFLWRHLGNAVLSRVGRTLYGSPVRDFNCGLRGFRTASARGLELRCPGMEAASEMIVKAARRGARIAEAPTRQRPALDPARASHLRVWRDGWRHLRLLLMLSPRWLYFYPGCLLLLAGALALLAPIANPVEEGGRLGSYTMLFGAAFLVCGVQLIVFALLAGAFCERIGLPDRRGAWLLRAGRALEGGFAWGFALAALGTAGSVWSLFVWGQTGGPDIELRMRVAIPSIALLICGVQLMFAGFFLALLVTQGAMTQSAAAQGAATAGAATGGEAAGGAPRTPDGA